MRKNKKRHQMQKVSEKQLMRQLLDESAVLGLFDQIGTDENGEPLYSISPNAEARAEILRMIIDSNTPTEE